MGMVSHVVGLRVPSDEYNKKVAAWEACVAAGISVPAELIEYFDGAGPDKSGMVVPMDDHICCSRYNDDMKQGFTIDLDKLPEDIRLIRFYNSY